MRQNSAHLNPGAGSFGDGQLLVMLAEMDNLGTVRKQNLRNQQAELAIPENRYSFARRNRNLIENFACRRDRLSEHGVLGSHAIWHEVQVFLRQSEEFLKSAGVRYDSQHASRRAVTPNTPAAGFAPSAGEIDLAHDAPANPAWVAGRDHLADELMPGRSVEPIIPALQLQIGVADPTANQPDQRKTLRANRFRDFPYLYHSVLQVNAQHA
jgi:hypothetical protein